MSQQTPRVLFISDKKFIDYVIPGGVQLCTTEFLKYIEVAGFSTEIFRVEARPSLWTRLSVRLHLEAYEIYNAADWLHTIIKIINEKEIKVVFLNQLNLSFWIPQIKKGVSKNVKFIGLSHGNESGDYLHQITLSGKPSWVKIWRLGKLLVKEKLLFSKLLDGVITISENETAIDQWLGAENILCLPRILQPDFINWLPQSKRIGFVGTLDHPPNFYGIDQLAAQLEANHFDGELRLIGSPADPGIKLENKYSFVKYAGILDNEQLKKEISTWSIFINPVFWYARGSSTKLSQGLNWGLPSLTTQAGARGYDLYNNSIITTDNTPKTFAENIIEFLNSSIQLNRLKTASAENAAHFNLDTWATKLNQFIKDLSLE